MAGKRKRFANSSGGWTYLPKKRKGGKGGKGYCSKCKGPHVYKHGKK